MNEQYKYYTFGVAGMDDRCLRVEREAVLGAASSILEVPLSRLRELAEAEREGRVVVLPCKVGDLIYDIRGDWETGKRLLVPHRVRSVYTEQKDGGTVEWEMYVSDFAFRVTKNTRMYFTKAEAERAIAATEPKGDAT